MPGLEQFMAFAETAKYGGFAAAARVQGVAPSTLAKAVGRLERELGVRLFHRTTRLVQLSADGERLYQRCQRVLDEVEALRTEAAGSRAAPTGELLVSAPVFYGRRFVMPLLAKLLLQHSGLRLDMRFTDLRVDLVRDGIDLAVRIGPLRDSTLVARRVDQQSIVLCASADYLTARGAPRHIDELASHDAIRFRLPTTGRDRPWQFRQRGVAVELEPQARVRVTETEGLVEAVKLGLGLCQVPDMLVQDELASGQLIEVLSSCRPAPLPINLVYASRRLVPARVRAAILALEPLRRRVATS
jgi:LysR family transcriptional regulator, regulator for bpeEF and oprC